MIYLFNSAFRTLYRTNILNTLCLPYDSINEYRYSITGKTRHVPPDFNTILKTLPSKEQVVIIFIDRFSENEYSYHPVRLGHLISHREEDQRLFFTIQLSDFIYPKNIDQFNLTTRKPLLDKGSPKLTNKNPEFTNDGYYCIHYQDIFSPTSDYFYKDEAWTQIVNSLDQTRSFESTSENPVIFIRTTVKEQNKNPISPKIILDRSVFNIVRNKQYELNLTYRFPIQLTDTNKSINATFSSDNPSFKFIDDSSFKIDSISNNIRIAFTTKEYPEDISGNITLKLPDDTLSPNWSISLKIVEQASFWLEVGFYGLVYALCDVSTELIGTYLFSTYSIPIKFLSALIKLVVLYLLFKKIGKKVF